MIALVVRDVLCYRDIGRSTLIVMFKVILDRLTTSRKYRGIKPETKVKIVKGVEILIVFSRIGVYGENNLKVRQLLLWSCGC